MTREYRTAAAFAQLHQAIQQGFGWQECRLWEFRLHTFQGRPIAGLPGGEEYDRSTPDAKTVKLNSYFTGKRVVEWCEYLYCFGDDWTHDVKLIAVHSDKESFKQRLLEGERAAPPEDCGGTPGYERMVHFLETVEDTYDDDPEGLETCELATAKARFDR